MAANSNKNKEEPLLPQSVRASGASVHASTWRISMLSGLAFILGSCMDSVLVKRATLAANFPAALTMLTALTGVVLYPLVVAAALLTGKVRPSQLCLPCRKPFIIAVCFVAHHMLLNAGAGGAAVPGDVVVILVKFVIPVSMCLDMLGLTSVSSRYRALHWIALLVLFCGCALTMQDQWSTVSWVRLPYGNLVLILLSTIPLAWSFKYIEVILKSEHKDMLAVALWAWVCLWMSVFTLFVVVVGGPLLGRPVTGALQGLMDGMKCYVLGQAPEDKADMDCASASNSWRANVLFAAMFNMAMPVFTRYGGASKLWFLKALVVPLSGVLFSQHWLMGDEAHALTSSQLCGLVVVMLAILMFNCSAADVDSKTNHP